MTKRMNAVLWLLLAAFLTGEAAPAFAQQILNDVLLRHGIPVKGRGPEGAFDDGAVPAVPVQPGSFAAPIAVLQSGDGPDRIRAAYTFAVLAGRSARLVPPADMAAVGPILLQMVGSDNSRTRIAGARVAGRVFARSFQELGTPTGRPAGLTDALFVLLNRTTGVDQLVAMDALGLLRESSAVPSLTERFQFYRDSNKRALAGGAVEALARIGDPSSVALVKALVGDKWATRGDSASLAVLFARERLLKDGSIAKIEQVLREKMRHQQARAYLAELSDVVP